MELESSLEREQVQVTESGIMVYVVDDDESVRRSLQRVLRSAGFSVQTFASAEAFQETSLPHDHACLVLDVHLGGMSGPDLRNILAESRPSLPVIFVTAHDDEHTQALVDGRSERAWLLYKPFSASRLLLLIEDAVRSRA